MNFGERIKSARLAAGFQRQKDLADEIGCKRETVTMWETNKVDQIGGEYLPGLSRAVKRSPEYLQTGKEPKGSHSSDVNSDWRDVLGYAANADMGDGAEDPEYQQAHKLKFRASSLRKQGLYADNLGIYCGSGDSMEPTFYEGDALMFNTAEQDPVDDELFIVMYDGRRLAKRLEKIGGRWFMTSDNKANPKWRKPVPTDDPRHEFSIVGRVRWVARWVK